MYGWRGADISKRYTLSFEKDYPEANTIFLSKIIVRRKRF
ncbi:hypothetical protein ACVNPX_15600 [Staphylococcus aureus]